MFAYNTTVSSITGVTPHYAMFGHKVRLPMDWVFPTASVEKKTMYHWTGDMMEERRTRRMGEVEHSDGQALDTEYPSGMFSVVSSLGPVIS